MSNFDILIFYKNNFFWFINYKSDIFHFTLFSRCVCSLYFPVVSSLSSPQYVLPFLGRSSRASLSAKKEQTDGNKTKQSDF